MSEKNTYWENQIKAFKQFQREIEGSTSSTAHTTYWLTGWDMGVKEDQKKIADLEDDLNAAIDEVKDKDKRIAELEAIVSRYIDDTCPRCGTFQNWTLRTNGERVCNNCYAVIEHHPPEGGADDPEHN